MAKYKCKVCGQTFESATFPEKCPICGAPASEIEEVVEPGMQPKPKKKGLDTNNNAYILIYSSVLVIVVAFLLAFVASVLKPMQDANVKIDTMQHKLNALNLRELDKSVVESTYEDLKQADLTAGDITIEVFNIDGQKKYVVPVSGRGLWGGISGYIALDEDLNTIFGTDFQHESETAGLGALIAEQAFQVSFCGKKVFADGTDGVALSVVKKGKQGNIASENYVDGITGATLTSNGVDEMLKSCLVKVRELNPSAGGGTKPACMKQCADCEAGSAGCPENQHPCGMSDCDSHEGCTGGHEGCTGGHEGCTGGHEGCTGGHEGCTGGHEGCTGGHEGCTGGHEGCTGGHEGCESTEPCDKCKEHNNK